MRRATLISAALITGIALAGCSSTTTSPAAAPPAGSTAPSASAPKKVATPVTAAQAVDALTKTVTTAKAGAEVTAANDGNHLLGRPGQYTSKVGFTDSRIKPADVEGMTEGDVAFGGAVEVFANADDAKARAAYIQAVTKNLPRQPNTTSRTARC